jgi:hypothetical protein
LLFCPIGIISPPRSINNCRYPPASISCKS